MPFSQRDEAPADDIVRRFELWIRDPVAAITVATGVVLTAITWITTFLVTVSSVAAYMGQTVRASPAEELVFSTRSVASFVREDRAAASADNAAATHEPGRSRSGSGEIITADSVRSVSSVSTVAAEHAASAVPSAAQSVDARSESVTSQLTRAAQHQGASGEQSNVVENGIAHAPDAQSPCPDGFWGSICKERIRWSYCHPDKWDTHAECVVQAFDLSYALN